MMDDEENELASVGFLHSTAFVILSLAALLAALAAGIYGSWELMLSGADAPWWAFGGYGALCLASVGITLLATGNAVEGGIVVVLIAALVLGASTGLERHLGSFSVSTWMMALGPIGTIVFSLFMRELVRAG